MVTSGYHMTWPLLYGKRVKFQNTAKLIRHLVEKISTDPNTSERKYIRSKTGDVFCFIGTITKKTPPINKYRHSISILALLTNKYVSFLIQLGDSCYSTAAQNMNYLGL